MQKDTRSADLTKETAKNEWVRPSVVRMDASDAEMMASGAFVDGMGDFMMAS